MWRAVARAIAAGGADDVTVVRAVAQALLDTWPLDGLRVRWGGGSVDAGDLGGPVRVLPLVLDGRPVGVAELIGESEPVDADVLELLAVRVAAGAGGADVRASARNHLAPSDVGTGHGPEDT